MGTLKMSLVSKSMTIKFDKTNDSKNGTKRNTLAESAILSMSDLDRIKKNAICLTKDEQENNKKILEDQKQIQQASAQAHKERIKEIDKKRSNKGSCSDIEKENLQSTNNLLSL